MANKCSKESDTFKELKTVKNSNQSKTLKLFQK